MTEIWYVDLIDPHRVISRDRTIARAKRAEDAAVLAAAPEMLAALEDAVGALEFSRDFHSDLGNEEQAFCQDKLDAATKAIAKAKGVTC
jgi:hypothetical protein